MNEKMKAIEQYVRHLMSDCLSRETGKDEWNYNTGQYLACEKILRFINTPDAPEEIPAKDVVRVINYEYAQVTEGAIRELNFKFDQELREYGWYENPTLVQKVELYDKLYGLYGQAVNILHTENKPEVIALHKRIIKFLTDTEPRIETEGLIVAAGIVKEAHYALEALEIAFYHAPTKNEDADIALRPEYLLKGLDVIGESWSELKRRGYGCFFTEELAKEYLAFDKTITYWRR